MHSSKNKETLSHYDIDSNRNKHPKHSLMQYFLNTDIDYFFNFEKNRRFPSDMKMHLM